MKHKLSFAAALALALLCVASAGATAVPSPEAEYREKMNPASAEGLNLLLESLGDAPYLVSTPVFAEDTIWVDVELMKPGALAIEAASQNGWVLLSDSGYALEYRLEGLETPVTQSGRVELRLVYTVPKHLILDGALCDTVALIWRFTPAEA